MGIDPTVIAKAIQDAFDAKSHSIALKTQIVVGSERHYECNVPGCNRRGYSKGKCHAHYKRMVLGKDLLAPLRNRKNGSTCSVCGVRQDGKGGWSLCAKHFKQERTRIAKAAVVKVFGDRCSRCGQSFPLPVYDFHHVKEKELSISIAMINRSVAVTSEELAKCVLMCANCHRLEHSNNYD